MTAIALDPRACRAYELGVPRLPVGAIVVGLTGERLRVRADGGLDEVLEVPRRWSVSADPCARRGARP